MKNVKVSLEQNDLFVAFAEYTIKGDNVVIDPSKLTAALTKAVFKRIDATKLGIKTGIKTSKPFALKVIVDNTYILDTEDLCAITGMDDKIKVNPSLYNKDIDACKKQFQDTVLYILDASKEFNDDIVDLFSE